MIEFQSKKVVQFGHFSSDLSQQKEFAADQPTDQPPDDSSDLFWSHRLNHPCKNQTDGYQVHQKRKKRRVEELADLIVKGLSQRQLIHHVRNQWGLCREQARCYIHEARALVEQDLGDLDRADMLASKVQMLEQMATDAVAAGHESNAIGVIRLLNELVGFGAGRSN